MISPVYWHPIIYKIVIRLLYGKEYKKRYYIIAKEIKNLKVLDLCCGDCELAKYIKKDQYRGVDFNKKFVKNANKKELNVIYSDIITSNLPKEECVLMQSSLYQFFPKHEQIINKMFKASLKKVIISEPVKNIGNSNNKFLRNIGIYLTKTKNGLHKKRFNRNELYLIAKKFNVNKIIELNRDLIMIFNKK